ncbi:MAG: leucyl aminopeptidase family protein, partial [Candidatus Dormibacteria bacterium]
MLAEPTQEPLAQLDVDAVVVPYLQGRELGSAAAQLDGLLDGRLAWVRDQGEATGKFPERTPLTTSDRLRSPRVILLALGRPEYLDGYRLRNALQFLVRTARRYCDRLAVLVEPELVEAFKSSDPSHAEPAVLARAVAEGVGLGNYELGQHKAAGNQGEVHSLLLWGLGVGEEVRSALAEGGVLAEATNGTRRLQWEPSNHLTPTALAEHAQALAAQVGLEFSVLERADMERLGMGSLLAVARGSHEPPKLVCLRHRPAGASGPVLGLVGKGITFDTGGISLKPNPGMWHMKGDMSGAAAVIQAMGLIARLGAPIEVLGITPLTENMPGGGAIKPGDVVTAMNGRSIEINNTDAEGRLVLADGLCYAAQQGATHLVDAATLTGGVLVALGNVVSGAMGTSPELLAA